MYSTEGECVYLFQQDFCDSGNNIKIIPLLW